MKYAFITAHPKHVHMFKNTINSLSSSDNECYCFAVNKDIVIKLLNIYEIKYKIIGVNKKSYFLKIIEGLIRLTRITYELIRKRPDIIIGQADPFFALSSRILKIKMIALPDSESAFLSTKIAIPLINTVIASNSYQNDSNNLLKIKTYFELLYLHPNVFIPALNINELLGIKNNEKYIVLRFVSRSSHHDIGHSGLSVGNKIKIVNEFSKHGKVLISSEIELPEKLKIFQINIPLDKFHDVLAGAFLYYGESATMAAESAVLGTPSIYLDDEGTGYTDELEKKYGLLNNYLESDGEIENSIKKGLDLLKDNSIEENWFNKKELMLKDKIDATAFLVWFIENYPESHKIMKENPLFQENFN